MSEELKCDFCSSPQIKWRYPCEDFVTPAFDGMSHGDWAACDECHGLIESGFWKMLGSRTVDTWPRQLSEGAKPMVLDYVLALHTLFRAFRNGPAVKL